jgi:amino acid transporter
MPYSIYTIGPLTADALAPATGYPIITLFFNATNSYAATNGLTAILILNFVAATISSLAAASRQLWAFARNKGLPFSGVLAPVRIMNLGKRTESIDFCRINCDMEYPLPRFLPLCP